MFGDAYLIGYSESFYCDIYIRCYITYLLNMGFLKFQKMKLSIFHIQPKSQHKSIIITYMTSFITSYLKKCFWTMMLEKTLKSPLDWKEIKPVNPKGNQSWIFTGRTDTETEAPVFGHLIQRANSLEKTMMLERMRAGGGGDRMR